LQVVLFDQHRDQLDLSLSLKQALAGAGEHVHYRGSAIHVAGWAKRFLFTNEQLEMPLHKLSGGEQSRVLIAQLMLKPADLLLLDEPTNDLDIASLEVLEQSLLEFPGALVLVTHDRYLLDRVSRQILALDGKGGAEFFADYDQWEAWKDNRGKDEEAADSKEEKGARREGRKRALSTNESKELQGMEKRIHETEAAIAQGKKQLEDPALATDFNKLMELQGEMDAEQAKVEVMFARWEELEKKKRENEA
jgi:ATP-binding cassette subfamily F protein uup